jgi:hypothetical protein
MGALAPVALRHITDREPVVLRRLPGSRSDTSNHLNATGTPGSVYERRHK